MASPPKLTAKQPVDPVESSFPMDTSQTIAAMKPDYLVKAKVRGAALELEFADGLTGTVRFDEFIDHLELNLRTLIVLPDGSGIQVNEKSGDPVVVDSPSLRYLADPAYAAKIDASIRASHVSKAELQELIKTHQPPPEWYDEDHSDLFKK